MNTNETYVSLETAKLLKQAGFNWNTFCCYRNNIGHLEMCHVDFNWNMDKKDYEKEGSDNIFHGFITSDERGLIIDDFVSAPALAVAQKWLREVKDTYVIPQISDYEVDGRIWEYDYRVGIHNINPIRSLYKYKSHEEALEAGIEQCLTIFQNPHEG